MPAPIRALSFDCFGTLIDWRFGQERVLRQLPSLRECGDRLQEIAVRREEVEQRLEAEPWMPYHEVLARSVAEACQSVAGVEMSPREAAAFAAGQLGWPAFPDSPGALARIAARYPIALLSNCDAEVLELAARKHLGAPIEWFVSAESVRSYKPAPAHWEQLLERSGLRPEEILHVSFARAYDLDQAASMGFSLGFVGRYGLQAPEDLNIRWAADDLAGLAELALTSR